VRNIPSPVPEIATDDHTARNGAPRRRVVSVVVTPTFWEQTDVNTMSDCPENGVRYVDRVPRWRRRDDDRQREREREALDIHDNIVQGIAEAQLAFDVGRPEQARAVLERTLAQARRIVTDLMGEPDPGDLRRVTSVDDQPKS
jgi:hypothetical protein